MDLELVKELLKIFKDNQVSANQVLPKKIINDELKMFSPEKKIKVRDAWHFLVGNGFIQEGNPEGPVLTRKGEEFINQNL